MVLCWNAKGALPEYKFPILRFLSLGDKTGWTVIFKLCISLFNPLSSVSNIAFSGFVTFLISADCDRFWDYRIYCACLVYGTIAIISLAKKKSMLTTEASLHLVDSKSIISVLGRCRLFPLSFRSASSVRKVNNIWPASIGNVSDHGDNRVMFPAVRLNYEFTYPTYASNTPLSYAYHQLRDTNLA